jgi:hypothetical protein
MFARFAVVGGEDVGAEVGAWAAQHGVGVLPWLTITDLERSQVC